MVRIPVLSMIFLLALGACTSPSKLDFAFSPTGGGKSYRSTTIEAALRRELRDESQPTVILVTTPSGADPEFQKQFAILKKLPAEELESLFVVACLTSCPSDVYTPAAEETPKLVGRSFRIYLLDGSGRVMKDSSDVLDATEIRAVIEQRWIDATPSS